ncbi:hypothetical protein RKD32_006044 [Streptomyces sp. SAI-195]
MSTASSLIRHSRESAYRCESSSFAGTSSKAGSPTQRPRSANAMRLASMKRCRYPALSAGGEVGALQDVEGLADRGAAGGGGRDGVDVQAAVGGLRRRLELGRVGREVLGGQVAGAGVPAGVRVDGRLVDGVDDVLAEFAVVDRADALARQLPVGARQVGVLERRAHDGEFAARQEQLGGVREVAEPLLVGRGLGAEGLVDGEAVPGQALGGLQHGGERAAAPPVEGRLPGGGRARGADGQTAGDGVGEGERLAVLREELLVGGERRGLATVDGAHGAGLGVVVDEVAAAPDPRGVGLGDAERGGGGHGGVDGVAALAEHLDAGGGGVPVDAGDRAAVPDGDGGLGGRGPAPGRGWRGRPHRHHHGGRDRQDRQIPCDRATHPHLQGKAVRAA